MRTAPRKARTGTAALGSHRPEPRGPAQWKPQPRESSPKPRTARESQPQESGPPGVTTGGRQAPRGRGGAFRVAKRSLGATDVAVVATRGGRFA